MRKILYLLTFSTFLIAGCSNTDKEDKKLTKNGLNSSNLDKRVDVSDIYSDYEIKKLFVKINTPNCTATMKEANVLGDVNSFCGCMLGKVADKMGLDNVRKFALPPNKITESEKSILFKQAGDLMPQASSECQSQL